MSCRAEKPRPPEVRDDHQVRQPLCKSCDMDNVGYGGVPVNERRFSNEHFATALVTGVGAVINSAQIRPGSSVQSSDRAAWA